MTRAEVFKVGVTHYFDPENPRRDLGYINNIDCLCLFRTVSAQPNSELACLYQLSTSRDDERGNEQSVSVLRNKGCRRNPQAAYQQCSE